MLKKTAFLGVMKARACGGGEKVAGFAFEKLKKAVSTFTVDLLVIDLQESFFCRHAFFSLHEIEYLIYIILSLEYLVKFSSRDFHRFLYLFPCFFE